MSIDRGKLLVACRRKLEAYRDAYGLEYVGGQELSSLLSDIDRALAQPAEAVEGAAWTPERVSRLADDCLQLAKNVEASKHDDAAQGAVAKVVGFDRGLPDLEWVNTVPLAKGDNLYTHPQAAPAQGDDSRRLDWLDANEAEIRYWREDAGDDEYLIWCTVVKGGKSISGHPLATAREAIDAAIAAAPSPEPQS
jgi:hypothetical protein